MGAATTARQRSKIDDIWASMNASESSQPGGASGSGVADGKGKGKTKKKKKANKKANKVKKHLSVLVVLLRRDWRSVVVTILGCKKRIVAYNTVVLGG